MTCAFAVRGAIKKFAGVESVDVSLNKGLATVKLKPGNSVTPEELWAAVKKNGFTPKETRVIVRGDVVLAAGKTQIKVTGTTRTYELVDNRKAPPADALKRFAGKALTMEGTITPGKDASASPPIQVEKVNE